MDEKLLLEKMQKAFGVEVDFTEIEQKHERKRKENKLLEQFAGALIGIREEPQSPIIEEVVEAVVIEPEPVVEEKQPEPEPELITEIGRQPEPELPKKDIVTQSVIALSKTNQQQGDIQKVADEIPDVYRRELDIIKKSIADFHRFAQRHSQMGGGGAGSVDELTFNVTSVTNSTYQIGRKDYYIGVNYPGPVTIYLPTQNLKQGRQVVVKDESGACNLNNITITTADGNLVDVDGSAILAINNGSLTFIFNNGWKII